MRDQSSDTGSEVTESQERRGTVDERVDGATPITPITPATHGGSDGDGDGEPGYEADRPVSLALRSEPASVRLARRFVDRWLGSAASSPFGEDVQLVTSELVTNAVRHSSLSALRLSRHGDCVILEVDDEGHGEPVIADHVSPTAASGRGLVIVDRLVTRWGWRPLPEGGKRVWCELCAPAG
jgi:anti-sigma regulatory factor (Ser/Thr protein kinase)